MPHICVSELGRTGAGNGLSPIRRQAIIYTDAVLLSIGPSGTKYREILVKIQNFSFTKTHLKISFMKWRPFYPGLDVLHVFISTSRMVKTKCYTQRDS